MLICAALTLSFAAAAWADYGAGRKAWQAGRYAVALKQWRQAARLGDRRAMVALGRAFVKGLGVPQDFVEAHKWLNLAAARGDAKAVAERDALAKEMTVEERAEARKLARAWRTAGRPGTTAARPRSSLLPRRMTGSAPARRVARPPVGSATTRKSATLRAVDAGDIAALEKALASGADPNVRGKRGWTPLMHAAKKGYKLLVPPLLKAGAKPNLQAADGATALFIAALRGDSEIVELLMKAGADPSIKGPKGKTAEGLMVARVVKKKYGGVKGLHKALRANERPVVIKALLDLGADIRARDVVLDEKYPSNKYFYTPLHTAARYNKHPEAVALLLERGASLNERVESQWKREPRKSRNTTAWELALQWNENPDVVKLLLDRGADVNARDKGDWTPLHWAARYNKNPDVAKLLLERGADVNARDKLGWTPLHGAAWNDNLDLALSKLLLEHGADLNARNKDGRTPLILALKESKYPEVVKLLLEREGGVNARDKYGSTLLHWAAANKKNSEAAKLLLERGAGVNARNKVGWTPLHWAAYYKNSEVAKLLLERGADVNARNKDGDTPLKIAEDRKSAEVARLLREHKKRIQPTTKKRTHSFDSPDDAMTEHAR